MVPLRVCLEVAEGTFWCFETELRSLSSHSLMVGTQISHSRAVSL